MSRRPNHQRWSDDGGRPRVLLECPPAASPSIIATLIERDGYEVQTCTGPAVTSCDLLEHGACALVDGADVVVNLLGPVPDDVAVLDAMTSLRRPPAIVAEVRGAAPDTVTAVQYPATRRALLRAIRAALQPANEP